MTPESKLSDVIGINEENEIKPRINWRDAFAALGEPMPKGISVLDYMNDCKAKGKQFDIVEWQNLFYPNHAKASHED